MEIHLSRTFLFMKKKKRHRFAKLIVAPETFSTNQITIVHVM
jgi:hypothetical protein